MPAPDPLLTSLCTTCHHHAPRYTCPRCGARSCSLPCVRRHKTRAACSGIRDVTAFVPRAQLRTPKFVDHDYNFLTAIERARERAARRIVDDRALFADGELDARANRLRGRWADGELRFFADPPPAAPGSAATTTTTTTDAAEGISYNRKRVRRLCRDMGLDVVAAPRGLSRQRENATAWNRRTGRINWQVEWLVYEEGAARPPTRVLHKALDDVPVYRAFAETMEWLIHRLGTAPPDNVDDHDDDDGDDDRPPRKHKRTHAHHKRAGGGAHGQDARTTAWATWTVFAAQNPVTGAWDVEDGAAEMRSWARDVEFEAQRGFRFMLLQPGAKPRSLLRVAADETLATALPGQRIVEFPTVVVLPPGEDLPPDHVLDTTPRPRLATAKPPAGPEPKVAGPKRRWPHVEEPRVDGTVTNPFRQAVDAILANGRAPAAKRRRVGAFAPIQEVEDGEMVGGEAMADDEPTSSEGSSSSDGEGQDGSDESSDEEGAMEEIRPGPVEGKPRLVMYDSGSDDGE